MTQEEKQLLLQDLCARLPYGVNINLDEGCNARLTGIDEDGNLTADIPADFAFSIDDIKPYLRPIATMTGEEQKELYAKFSIESIGEKYVDFGEFMCEGSPIIIKNIYGLLDWLNTRHFDYRGLIEKGLALEAKKGMYEF